MGRQCAGVDTYGTVNSTTLSIAFMEFLSEGDSNLMKQLWRSYGWDDISPIWGHKATVPTFKQTPSIIAQWPDFQQQMTDCEADWYYLSGHHGRQFAADDDRFENGLDLANYLSRAGFFNEPYHMGRWHSATLEQPDKGQRKDEIYMTMSEDDWLYELGPSDNPLYNAPHENCLGVMLVGCNSLAFRSVRAKLNQYFPNAVIIGVISKEVAAINKILKVIKPLGREFFIDPKWTIDPEELAARLTPVTANQDHLAVLADGNFYFRAGKRVQVLDCEEEVLPEHTR